MSCRCKPTPTADARALVNTWNSLSWASEASRPYTRDSVRAMWQAMVETYGRDEAESLVYLTLDRKDYDTYALTSMGDSEPEIPDDEEEE